MKIGRILSIALVAFISDRISSIGNNHKSNSMIRSVSAAFTVSSRNCHGSIAESLFLRNHQHRRSYKSCAAVLLVDGRVSFLKRGMTKTNESSNQEDKDEVTNNNNDGAVIGLEEKLESYRNPSNRDDQVFSAISANGELKVTAATTRNVINDLMMQHTLTAVPADALGRAITCSLLLSNGMQEEQIFQLTLNCKYYILFYITHPYSIFQFDYYIHNLWYNIVSCRKKYKKGEKLKKNPSK